MNAKFQPGRLVATPGALGALADSGQSIEFFLQRHLQADWGDVDAEDWKSNDQALVDGDRLLSSYHTLKGVKVWLLTEASDGSGQRTATTLLLPDDY